MFRLCGFLSIQFNTFGVFVTVTINSTQHATEPNNRTECELGAAGLVGPIGPGEQQKPESVLMGGTPIAVCHKIIRFVVKPSGL